jgi:phosphoribosylamine--glycine ligase
MRILVIGSGGREHALVTALSQSPTSTTLYAAPGNPGTAQHGTNVDVDATNLDGLVAFAQDEAIDLTIVGPEQPLVNGIVDRFEDAGLRIVGPTAEAARLEGSKAFADQFMDRHGIPTAAFHVFEAEDYDEAADYLNEVGAPIVVKADGLAAGKGSFVCSTLEEAHDALDEIVTERAFGAAGDRVVIEDRMEGEEVSVLALTDGSQYVLLTPSQDHKPIGEGGTGPNTGGMGAFAPAPIVDDPEAQVVLPLVESDLVSVFDALADGTLDTGSLRAASGAAACVVLASGGYPIEYETGYEISGIEEAEALPDVSVVHAGTARSEDGTFVTAGGRVLGVTARGADLPQALDRAYEGVDLIDFNGKTLRSDIGEKGLAHLSDE